MKLLIKLIVFKIAEIFSMNIINKLLYKITRFIKFLLKTIINIIVNNFNLYFTFLDQISSNLLTNLTLS